MDRNDLINLFLLPELPLYIEMCSRLLLFF